MEPRAEEEEGIEEESNSKQSQPKSRRIKKSPKPQFRNSQLHNSAKKDLNSSLGLLPQFGVFESQMQKQTRLQKFWLVEIDNYYRQEISSKEKQMLSNIIEEQIPSLQEVITQSHKLPHQRVPFQELFRYIDLVKECRIGSQLMLVQNEEKRFLAIFDQEGELDRMVEISQEQAFLLGQRHKFLIQLKRKEEEYNRFHNENHNLSQISAEVAFLLYLMRQNKLRINNTLTLVQSRIHDQPYLDPKISQNIKDQYVTCLIRKNLRRALQNEQIHYFNYFANLDSIEQYGGIDPQQKVINDKKEFEEYMKKKKGKKSRKNPKGVLKTSCGGCLSPLHEQYNPFIYCPECHVRFHKFCYTPFKDNLCQSCFHKKQPVFKARAIQCQFCSNRGLLSAPLKSSKESVSIHVFCMLINDLWTYENGALEFKSKSFVSAATHEETCSICNLAVCTFPCSICQTKVHPLCAYLSGWNMQLLQEGGVSLQCCEGVDLQKNSYRRKFMLNYKKLLYKEQRER